MRTFSRLLGITLEHKWQLTGAYVCLLVSSGAFLVVPRLLGDAIDTALEAGGTSKLLLAAGTILGVSVIRGIFAYGQQYLGESLGQKVSYRLRNTFYNHLQGLSFAYFDQQHTGNLMSRATVDVENLRMFISMVLIRSLYLIILLVAVSVILINMNWQLGLLSLSFTPLLIFRSVVVSRSMRVVWARVQESIGQLTTLLQENLTGARVIRAFGAEGYEKEKFNTQAWQVAEETIVVNRLRASNTSFMTFIFTVALALILWFGGRLVARDELTAGQLAQFIFYLGMLAMPVRMSGDMLNGLSRAISSGERIFQVLDTQSPVKEKPTAITLPRTTGNVCFENVSFSYDSSVPTVKNIDFEVEPGQVVALLGAPGSGKSTIVHLLPRFYDVNQGRITIDGIDIRDATLPSLRRNIGIVMQDVFLFNDTIRANIAYGGTEAREEDIIRAAKIAQLHDFIQELPQGYDSWVGERGVTLSGGQRQRVAIARSILLDPPILILDDSTSSVDTQTEELIRKALNLLVSGRTTFVIAHRLSTVHNADTILILKDGEIVERGTHQQLLRQSTLYRDIYELQLRPQEEVMLETTVVAEGGGT